MKNEPLLRECRGIVLSPSGVRSRPFPFIPTIDFSELWEYLSLDNSTIKINGRMVTGLLTRSGIQYIGKGGALVDIQAGYEKSMSDLIKDSATVDLTPVFEITDYDHPIVMREPTGTYLVGLRSIRSGRMARPAELILLANEYGLKPVTIFTPNMLGNIDLTAIEGVVVNNGNSLVRTKTPFFRELQKITSIIRFGREGEIDSRYLDKAEVKKHLTSSELEKLNSREV